MNIKTTQKALLLISVVLGILRTFKLIEDSTLILLLVFGFGGYISLIVTEIQDRLSKIEKDEDKEKN